MARAEASWFVLGSPWLTVLPGYGAARCRDPWDLGMPMGLALQPPPAPHRDASAGAGSPVVLGAKGRGADKEEPGVASQLLPARHAGRAGISARPASASPWMGREGGAGPWLLAEPWGFWQLQEHMRWQLAFPRASPSPSPRGRLVALGTHWDTPPPPIASTTEGRWLSRIRVTPSHRTLLHGAAPKPDPLASPGRELPCEEWVWAGGWQHEWGPKRGTSTLGGLGSSRSRPRLPAGCCLQRTRARKPNLRGGALTVTPSAGRFGDSRAIGRGGTHMACLASPGCHGPSGPGTEMPKGR